MPYKEKEIKKLYYSIGEVAEMFDVNTSLIRFWEKEFTVLKPKKNKKGNRLFTEKDLENLKLIYDLVKVKGFTLDGAKLQLRKKDEEFMPQEVAAPSNDVVDRLEQIKKKLIALGAE